MYVRSANCLLYMYIHACFKMRDEKEERKKQARSNKQTRQSNTVHPRQSLFLEKMSCLRCMYMKVESKARSKQTVLEKKRLDLQFEPTFLYIYVCNIIIISVCIIILYNVIHI